MRCTHITVGTFSILTNCKKMSPKSIGRISNISCFGCKQEKKNPQEQNFCFVYIRNFNSNVSWKILAVNRNVGNCFHVLHPKLLIVEIRLHTYCLHVDNHLAAPWMNEYVHSCNYSRMLSIHICITTWCIPNFDVTYFELSRGGKYYGNTGCGVFKGGIQK